MSEQLADILTALPLFETLNSPEIAALIQHTAPQRFAANQAILVEGETPFGLYVLLSGKVAVMKYHGGAHDHLCDLDAGECVGEVEIVDGSACAASVVCYGDVEAAVLPKENLEHYFATQPAAAIKILRQMVKVLASRLRQTNASYSSLKRIAESAQD